MKLRSLLLILLAGCGSSPPPKVEEPVKEERSQSSGPKLQMSQELGSIDERKVEQTFASLVSGTLENCHKQGRDRVEYLTGDVKVFLRIDGNGRVKYGFFEDSTLGDRETESCMLDALRAVSWPKPVGGEQGIAKRQIHFDPGGDERPPVAWSAGQLGAPWKKAKPAVSECMKKAGTGPIKATLYVDTDGKPQAVGASVSDEKGEAALACVVEVLRSTTFPSPGSYASKVSVEIR